MNESIRPYPILLPEQTIDPRKWAVVACDQFTSEPSYWRALEEEIGDAPSTLKMILPEAFLSDNDEARIDKINATMRRYLDENRFRTVPGGMILTCRETGYGRVRMGVVTSIDLETYSFDAKDHAPVRATEGTVLSRIPPRVKIRRNAPLELPHVMMLIDDETDSVQNAVRRGEKLYDFELIADGGRLTGWTIDNPDEVRRAYRALLSPLTQVKKYGFNAQLQMAVGDGNHSLASAKAYWEEIRDRLPEERRETHPARYALAEIVNLYDPGIVFEPINRVVFGETQELIRFILAHSDPHSAVGRMVTADGDCLYPAPSSVLAAVRNIDDILEKYARKYAVTIDYVHGEDSVRELTRQNDARAVGILLPALDKSELFRVVANGGILPRKTFSLGEAREKRYYNECKRIQ